VAPNYGVHFWFDRKVPMKEPFVRLDTTTQWIL